VLGSGQGIGRSAYTVAVSGSDLHVGGEFTTAGGKVSAYVARAVLELPPAPVLESATLAGGVFTALFTCTPSTTFTGLAATNVSLPLNNWTVAGSVTEVSPGPFQFTDPQATNSVQRYYRIRSP
jgi:hypothetical protein